MRWVRTAMAVVVFMSIGSGVLPLAPGSDLGPIELQPYRIAAVVDGGGQLEEKAVDRWAASVRVGLRAAAGTLWTVEKVAVLSGASSEAIERVSPKADKLFLCRLAKDADGRTVVRVHMRDWVVGPGADQVVAVRLTSPAELADATLRGVAAVFGARGEVHGAADGLLMARIQGSALMAADPAWDVAKVGAFGRLVIDDSDSSSNPFLCAIIAESQPTRVTLRVYTGGESEANQTTRNGARIWWVGQRAATSGTWLRLGSPGNVVAGWSVAATPLEDQQSVQPIGRTDPEGLCWLPRSRHPLWVQVRFAGVIVRQEPVWPGAVEAIDAKVELSQEQLALVRQLAEARIAVEESAIEVAAWLRKSQRAEKAGRAADARAAKRHAERVATEVTSGWQRKLEQLRGAAMPASSAAVWQAQSDQLLRRLESLSR